jgi:hypothetical protein
LLTPGFWPVASDGFSKPKPKSTRHDHRKTYVSAAREKSALRLVAGVDFTPSPDTPPAHRKRKARGPYKERRPIEYQDGLPVIDPAGEEDPIFRYIAEHRAAVVHYDRCVTVEQEAEGKVSDDEHIHLRRNTKNAFDEMMLWARCVILTRPITRRGLIHQARYLASQFNDLEGCDGGCMYLPDVIGERQWTQAFLQSLAAGLRKMGGELDPANEGGRQ